MRKRGGSRALIEGTGHSRQKEMSRIRMQDGRERCALVTGTGGGCHKRRVISDPERAWGRLDVASPVLVRKFRIGKSGKRLPCSMDVVWAADPQRMLISPASRCVDFMSRTIDNGSVRFKEKDDIESVPRDLARPPR